MFLINLAGMQKKCLDSPYETQTFEIKLTSNDIINDIGTEPRLTI